MKKILMCVVMVAVLAACSKGEGEDGFIMSPMSDPDDVCSAMDDAYFMQYCYANFDINGDAKVSKAEAAAVTSMQLYGFSYTDKIKSIRGIEYFVNLEDIDGDFLDIEVVDLRANTKLQKVEFSRCYDLVEVRLLNGVTSIHFSDCASLAIVAIPNSVTSIGMYAFAGCESLASITIPNSVTSIESRAFAGCSSLASITIPNSVTSIGYGAFSDCSSLTSITIPNSVTLIGEYAFAGCSSLAKIEGKFSSQDGRCLIVDGEMVAFAPYGLTTYAIPEGVTSIAGAFDGCSSLTSITIPNSVTSIVGAFYGCSSLTSITIPEGVTLIESGSFQYCSNLMNVYCKPTTPPRGESWMFDYNVSGRKIYVPRASVDAYKQSEDWSDYADEIVGYDF